jgi:hypothetical protein
MNILALIGSALKLLVMFFSKLGERDAKKKKMKQEASNEVKAGLKSRDPIALMLALIS